ncbi:MAG: ABC transporter ATP-binding protein, partial [Janthinobacterium lividum]
SERFPRELSGGQQQRIGIARAIAAEPDVLLLDEPLSNLDAKLREQMSIEISDLQHRLGITVVFVTHDHGEALSMSSRVAIMDQGRIREIGTPEQLYFHPTTYEAAAFLGDINLIPVARIAEASSLDDIASRTGERFMAVRPESITISATRPEPASDCHCVLGTLEKRVFRGGSCQWFVAVPQLKQTLVVNSRSHANNGSIRLSQNGDQVYVAWAARDAHVVSKEA